MSTKFFFFLSSWLFFAVPLTAQGELESLRALVKEQERQIRQLEEENVRLRLTLEQRRTEQRTRETPSQIPLPASGDDASRGLVPAVPAGSASPAAARRPALSGDVHVVQPGDNLTRIARQAGCTVADLLRVNELKIDSVIRPGQQLRLPARPDPAPTPAPQVPSAGSPTSHRPATSASVAVHTVQTGETIHSIARKRGISPTALLASNPGIRPTAMRAGQKLRLPPDEPTGPATTSGYQEPMLISSAVTPPVAPQPRSAAVSGTGSRMVLTDGKMTYAQFAAKHQTTVDKLNELNALVIPPHATLAKGAELRVPTW